MVVNRNICALYQVSSASLRWLLESKSGMRMWRSSSGSVALVVGVSIRLRDSLHTTTHTHLLLVDGWSTYRDGYGKPSWCQMQFPALILGATTMYEYFVVYSLSGCGGLGSVPCTQNMPEMNVGEGGGTTDFGRQPSSLSIPECFRVWITVWSQKE